MFPLSHQLMNLNYPKILTHLSAVLIIMAAFTLNVLETERSITIALAVSATICMLSAFVVTFVQAFRKMSEAAKTPKPTNLKNTDMEKKKQSFVAIDFEYLIQGRHDTPCQVGLVKVVNNVVVLRYATLIYVPESIGGELAYGNGITREMVADAPTFFEVIRLMESFCKDSVLVAHNSSTEESVLRKACAYHDIDSPLASAHIIDTCRMYGGKGLAECCAEHHIPLNHHDALSDAEACARLYVLHDGGELVEEQVRTFGKSAYDTSKTEVYKVIPDDEVVNKDTPFFGGVKTVVTGTFTNFPDRAVLKEKLKALGADVDTSVTKRTKILVAGSGCGPKKLEKALEYGATVMTEEEVLVYLT